MHIVIIGAGFCGLAACWHLLNQFSSNPDLRISIFDAKGVGGGASGMAAGLLHPFAGAHAKLNWMGREGFAATLELLEVSSQALGHPVTAVNRGILRLALSAAQQADFTLCAQRYPDDANWWSESQVRSIVPFCTPSQGLWIKEGITVNAGDYLKGLWLACQNKGAKLFEQSVEQLDQLPSYDLLILAAGASVHQFTKSPLTLVKGQTLELAWPKDLPPVPCPLNSQAYLIMQEAGKSVLVGASYERDFSTAAPDMTRAREEILPKVIAMIPALEKAEIIGCFAGIRVSTPNHLPLIHRFGPKELAITGMGSKGLLYHALISKSIDYEKENL